MLNKIILQGRFASDIDLRKTNSGTSVVSATLAVQRIKKSNTQNNTTDFVDCVFWGKLAEHVKQWFSKGDMALVSGRLESRDWEDKNGNKRRSWEVQCESIDFCGSKKEREEPRRYSNDDFEELDDAELPF